jgi:hypothetical protein
MISKDIRGLITLLNKVLSMAFLDFKPIKIFCMFEWELLNLKSSFTPILKYTVILYKIKPATRVTLFFTVPKLKWSGVR